jgi:LCP family protein required for cell wall assembly
MQNNGNKKLLSFIIKIFSIIALGATAFAIYEILLLSSIENLIRYIVIGILILIDIVIIIKFKSKKKPKGTYLTFLFFLSLICIGVGLVISYFYGQIDNLNKDKITYTSDMLVMSWSNAKSIQDIKDMKIGILKDKKSPEGYIIPKEIIKENNLEDDNQIVEYEDYTSMLVDMYAKEIDSVFVPDSYVSMFSGITGYETIDTDTRVIISKDKLMKKAATSKIETASSGKDVTEPFTILLMGIDSTEETLAKNAIANGDTLILITFNPKTLNATMLSIPRDSYVPIACWSGKPENKITHAAAYGNDCMINTIENYFDVNIDYYAKMNFKGLVKLVNAVDGVEVDVPKTLCTDDSGRMKIVCIQPGRQVLMGEEALVYARNRKQLADGVFGRDAHQQEIIKALINKMKDVRDVSKFMEILNAISANLDTNLTTKQILSFYNVAKDIVKKSLSSEEAELVNIQQLYLDGDGQMIYDERAKMVLWDYVPNKNSRDQIINAMKTNLELKNHEDITDFSFSINNPYEKQVIGWGASGGFKYTLLPDFTGDTEEQATATANKLGIKVKFEGTGGTVIEQNYPASKRVDLIKDSLILKLSGTKKKTDDDDDKKKDDDDDDNDNDDKKDEKDTTTEDNNGEDKKDDDKKEDE